MSKRPNEVRAMTVQNYESQQRVVNLSFQRQASDMVLNLMSMRMKWLNKIWGKGRTRDIAKECRYPTSLDAWDYREMFDWNGIAKRVVTLEPSKSWEVAPEIYDSEDSEETPFEKAFKDLDDRHRVLCNLYKADVLSGIGRYGVILLGLDDLEPGDDLSNPIAGFPTSGRLEDMSSPLSLNLLFMRTLDESLCQIVEWESDPFSPRFGQPVSYNLTLLDPSDQEEGSFVGTTGPGKTNVKVHWTRVIHIADNTLSSHLFGTPRMKDVSRYLTNIDKILGANGEGFWLGAFPGLAWESQPDNQFLELDEKALKKQMRMYQEGFQRYIAAIGMTVKSLSVQVTDPGPHFDTQCKAIAIAKNCPYRVFMGTEEGKLAGGQDSEAWDERMDKRRPEHITPNIIRPTIDRFIILGILPIPQQQSDLPQKEGPQPKITPPAPTGPAKNKKKKLAPLPVEKNRITYKVDWPDLSAPSDAEVANVANVVITALKNYVSGSVNELITPEDMLIHILKLDPEVVKIIMENAVQQQSDVNQGGDVLLGGPSPEEIKKQAQQEMQMKQLAKQGIKPPPGVVKNRKRLKKWIIKNARRIKK